MPLPETVYTDADIINIQAHVGIEFREEKNKDIDRRLEETTKELQREREKLMAVIRMSGDLIFEYDIAKDQMHYAGPEEGSLYCGQITEGYTEQLLREVDNRSDAVEQQRCTAASRIFVLSSARRTRKVILTG